MKLRILAMALSALGGAAIPAAAQTSSGKVTVSSLLAQDYQIAGSVGVPSGGAGLFLRKDRKLYFCYLTETPKSATVTTDYCKPVE